MATKVVPTRPACDGYCGGPSGSLVDRPKSMETLKIGPVTKPAGFHATADASSATATKAIIADARFPNDSSPCAATIDGTASKVKTHEVIF